MHTLFTLVYPDAQSHRPVAGLHTSERGEHATSHGFETHTPLSQLLPEGHAPQLVSAPHDVFSVPQLAPTSAQAAAVSQDGVLHSIGN